MWDTRLKEGGELNVEEMWRGESKKSASSQMQKWEKKSKLPPSSAFYFSLWFFLSLCFFFFLLLEKKKMAKRKCLKQKGRNKRPEVGSKSERAEWELEGKFFPFSSFYFSLWFFFCFFIFSLRRRRCQEKTFEIEGQKWEGRNGNQKWEGRMGAWRKGPSFFCISFLLYRFFFFVFFSSAWEEEHAKRKRLKQNGRNESQKWEGRTIF